MLSDLERLVAIEDIKFMRVKFFRALDRRDYAELESLLAEDAKVFFTDESGNGLTPPVEFTGPAAFSAFVREYTGTAKMIHIGTMPQIEILSADKANGLWFCEGYSATMKERGLPAGVAIGLGFETLEDEYVRVNGKWVISVLKAKIQAVI